MIIPKFIEKEAAQARYDICKQCPELEGITARCRKCGCFMKLKVKLAESECPLGLWGKVLNTTDK